LAEEFGVPVGDVQDVDVGGEGCPQCGYHLWMERLP
jgi:hypothetical protein